MRIAIDLRSSCDFWTFSPRHQAGQRLAGRQHQAAHRRRSVRSSGDASGAIHNDRSMSVRTVSVRAAPCKVATASAPSWRLSPGTLDFHGVGEKHVSCGGGVPGGRI